MSEMREYGKRMRQSYNLAVRDYMDAHGQPGRDGASGGFLRALRVLKSELSAADREEFMLGFNPWSHDEN